MKSFACDRDWFPGLDAVYSHCHVGESAAMNLKATDAAPRLL
jgi:hypothetical protein